MVDGSPQQWKGNFLGDNIPPAQEGKTTHSQDESADVCPNQPRPLQLPRVGWGVADDDESGVMSNAQHLASNTTGRVVPTLQLDGNDGGLVQRALSRNSEGELAPIPEDISMHGAWPDYYPDILGCYNYDDQKKTKYRRCGPNFNGRLCAAILLVLAAIIGSRGYYKMARNHNQHLPQSKPQPSSNTEGNMGNGTTTSSKTLENTKNTKKNEYPPDVDVYQVIVDTLRPLMFDDSTSWDGTYFHAFEFCGTEYSRVPCPYIAYCPLGPGRAPLGGTKVDADGSSWAPIFDRHRDKSLERPDWVQLGGSGTCETYSKINSGHAPPWGNLVGEGGTTASKGITKHVMCCLESVKNGTEWTYAGGGQELLLSNDPDFIDRPPSLEEDEVEKPLPVREEEEGGRDR